MPHDEKKNALDLALTGLHKRFGNGSVMRMSERTIEAVEAIPTGSLKLDSALGIGGYPRGRVIEVYGPESSGKTTLALHAIAEAQKLGGTAAFIDAEHALDVQYARALGVDVDNLLVSQPDSGEQALEIAESLVRSGALDILVIDSVAALVPQAELEGQMGDAHMGLQARLMSQALRKITAVTSRTGCLVIFLNQVRQKIGVVFGNAEVTPGGNALKFYASCRLEVRRAGAITSDKENVGAKTKIKVVKNKVAPPFRSVEVDILYGTGLSRAGELIDLAEAAGVLQKSGSWFSYKGEKLGQGKENTRERIVRDPVLFAAIAEQLRGKPIADVEIDVGDEPSLDTVAPLTNGLGHAAAM
jgi:recombination protein RecA